MRIALATTGLIAALLTAGCGGAPEDERAAANGLTTFDVQESGTARNVEAADPQVPSPRDPLAPDPIARPAGVPAPPHVSPDAAPDVAFGYLYSFGLAADQIAPVQQRHARLCEELGAERCRVTGMNYRRKNEDDVEADLSLALEPGLAHRFGERALDGVREAEGKLVDSKISGTDVGSGIRAGTRSIAQIEEELAELEAQIARGGRIGTLRDLRAQVEMLRRRLAALRTDRGERREQLATTNMTLRYSTDGVVGAPDFGGAFASAWSQTKWMAYGLFVILVALLPWLLALGLILLGLRALRRRAQRDAAPEAAPIA